MSKLIVEMEMPKACRWKEDGMTKLCPIAEWGTWSGSACSITELFEPSGENRPSGCPIKGILPEEHGDLIDRDDLMKECYHDDEYDLFVVDVGDVLNAKVVIAAEREDDEKDSDTF